MVTHDKISFAKSVCKSFHIKYSVRRESLHLNGKFMCYSLFNLTYSDILKLIRDTAYENENYNRDSDWNWVFEYLRARRIPYTKKHDYIVLIGDKNKKCEINLCLIPSIEIIPYIDSKVNYKYDEWYESMR